MFPSLSLSALIEQEIATTLRAAERKCGESIKYKKYILICICAFAFFLQQLSVCDIVLDMSSYSEKALHTCSVTK